jgi:protein-S-isoprenylcysteine O-methyltransferase Ste14
VPLSTSPLLHSTPPSQRPLLFLLADLVSRRRMFTVTAVPAVLVIISRPTYLGLGFGLLLVILGQAIRLWAAGYIHKKMEVTTGGPYAHVRNPLYVGSVFISTGFAAMADVWWAWLIIAIQYVLIYHFTVLSEERHLEELLGDVYQQYRSAVPRWLPAWRPYQKRSGRFNPRQVMTNNEFNSMGLVVITCLLFLAKMIWMAH